MIYFNINTKTATDKFINDATTIQWDDERVVVFFSPLESGNKLSFDIDGFPFIEPIPAKTQAELGAEALDLLESAIYVLLDKTALSFGFKSPFPMDRAAGYKGSSVIKYSTYATTLTDWRDSIFEYVEAQEAEITLGNRPMPTIAEMLLELNTNFPTPVKP